MAAKQGVDSGNVKPRGSKGQAKPAVVKKNPGPALEVYATLPNPTEPSEPHPTPPNPPNPAQPYMTHHPLLTTHLHPSLLFPSLVFSPLPPQNQRGALAAEANIKREVGGPSALRGPGARPADVRGYGVLVDACTDDVEGATISSDQTSTDGLARNAHKVRPTVNSAAAAKAAAKAKA